MFPPVVHTHRSYSSDKQTNPVDFNKNYAVRKFGSIKEEKHFCFLQAINRLREWITSLQGPEILTFGIFGIRTGQSSIIEHSTRAMRKRLLFCIISIIIYCRSDLGSCLQHFIYSQICNIMSELGQRPSHGKLGTIDLFLSEVLSQKPWREWWLEY